MRQERDSAHKLVQTLATQMQQMQQQMRQQMQHQLLGAPASSVNLGVPPPPSGMPNLTPIRAASGSRAVDKTMLLDVQPVHTNTNVSTETPVLDLVGFEQEALTASIQTDGDEEVKRLAAEVDTLETEMLLEDEEAGHEVGAFYT